MSHFTVLVRLTAAEVQGVDDVTELLKAKMQPYHEYECTGIKDKYVVRLDVTDEYIDRYKNDKLPVVYRGGVFYGTKYSKQCSRFFDSGYSGDGNFQLPSDSYELREVPATEVYTFEEYLVNWYGLDFSGKYNELQDERLYQFTNPNAKWDYYKIGGRWSNFFLSTDGTKKNIINKGAWDIQKTKDDAVLEYEKYYDIFEKNSHRFDGVEFIEWEKCIELCNSDYDDARTMFWNQPYRNILKEIFYDNDDNSWLVHAPETFFNVSREQYLQTRMLNALQTYAVLDDAWYEKGEMGWFGISSNEDADWGTKYLDKIESFDDNDILIMVDCHI